MSAASEDAGLNEVGPGIADPCRHLDPYPEVDPYPDVEPWPDRTAIPDTDTECRVLVDDAVSSLIVLRGGSQKDPGAYISVLVSLAVETDGRVPDAVADAREKGYSWDCIADRLATTVAAARHRYAWYVSARRSFPL
ncbi:MAG: hypothetical protein ACRDZY_00135 [Acidimicrobiales bacterium]